MARLLLPPLSQAAEAYVVSITGYPAAGFDPARLAADQLEQLHVVLEAELEFVRERIAAKAGSPVASETEDDKLNSLAEAVAEITRLLAVCGR